MSSTSLELGNRYGVLTTECLGNLLHDKAPAMLVSKKYLGKISAIYKEPIQLVHMGDFGLIQEMADASTMLRWLEDFEAVFRGERQETFRPFLHSGMVTELGPDLICGFAGKVQLSDGSFERQPVMAIFQHKLRNSADLNDAFNTLDVDEFFFHRKERRSEASSCRMQRGQDEEEAVMKFKALCARGGLLKLVVTTAIEISETRKGNVFDVSYGDRLSKKRWFKSLETSSGALVGIIDSEVQFMEPEDVHLMGALKSLKQQFNNE